MKHLTLKILLLILVLVVMDILGGCSKATLSTTLKDGRLVSIEYVRWFNQTLDGFRLKAPDGWELSFDHQKSDIEIAYNLGAMSIGVGGGSK